ncbi:MAG: thiamine pyrophosphate-dependent dehydrogenase E1 component subunit alpha [Actinobacteria bacterium]|nr:thiamine pyrophosphate-dependent dehydrogenase E1 component subunit alpha [Actinomycetota bacterium]
MTTREINLEKQDTDLLISLFKNIIRLRKFEDKVYQLFLKGELPGTIHQYQGQEAVAVGVCSVLEKNDWITSTHRPHGHTIAKGVKMRDAMAELYGKETGCCKGKGGSMHLGDPAVGMVPAIAIVAGGISIVTGIGLAFKMKKTKQVAACFFGEGATNEGAFHEGLNMASYQKLPIIYVCENNIYGASTSYNKTTLVEDVSERVKSYGMRSVIVDGMNVVEVYLAAKEAKESILNGEGPILIEAKTYRFAGHSRGDAKKYRTKEEEEYWKNLDPIERMKDSLFANNLLDNETYALILKDIQEEIDDAVLFAQQSNYPPVEDAFIDAYASEMKSPRQVQL